MSNPTVPDPEELKKHFEALSEAIQPRVSAIVDIVKQTVTDINAKGGYFTDDGKEVGYFEYQDYQKNKVQNEIAQLRAELVDEDAES
jgi:hypothetical protein